MKNRWKTLLTVLSLSALLSSSAAHAMGERAYVFENATSAAIWDHGASFYLRLSLDELGGLQNPTFIWAGFQADSTEPGLFTGELVTDQFGANERHFPARARRLLSTPTASYFLIEVLDAAGATTKEFFLKGESLHGPVSR